MSKNSGKKHVQLTLDQARKPTGRGGWRPNSGRPKGRTKVTHDAREEFNAAAPQHVTLRVKSRVPDLRREAVADVIRGAIAKSHKNNFRIAEYNIEPNHIHLATEASSKTALSRGIGGTKTRIAKRINALLGTTGKVFAERYHSRVLRTPLEVRNALRYILNNALHHAEELGKDLGAFWIDPCSSAIWFDGWETPIEDTMLFDEKLRELFETPSPVEKPRTWLLSVGWRKHGLLRIGEKPATSKKQKRKTRGR